MFEFIVGETGHEEEGRAMMTCELRYLIKTNSNCEGCSDQASLASLLTDLRAVADDLELNFTGAHRAAEVVHELRDQSPFSPRI